MSGNSPSEGQSTKPAENTVTAAAAQRLGADETLGPALDSEAIDLATPAGRALAIEQLARLHAADLCRVAPDMRDFADSYAMELFARLVKSPAFPEELAPDQEGISSQENLVDAVLRSGKAFYERFGREVLGPISVHFVRSVLLQAPDGATVAFPARDAEIFYNVAQVLNESSELRAKGLRIVHPTINRRTLGIQDEMTGELTPPDRRDPLFHEYLQQQGFFSPNGVVIADVGCWGTIISCILDAKQQGILNIDLKGVHFLFSHLREIRGFMNLVGRDVGNIISGVDSEHLEAVADSFEALPRDIMRSTSYRRDGSGVVVPDYSNHKVESPFLASWRDAMYDGARLAARSFLSDPLAFPSDRAALLTIQASHLSAQRGDFTGIFGHNTPTWSEGERWRASWRWGPIAPVTSADLFDA